MVIEDVMKNKSALNIFIVIALAMGTSSSAFAANDSTCEGKYKVRSSELRKQINDLEIQCSHLTGRPAGYNLALSHFFGGYDDKILYGGTCPIELYEGMPFSEQRTAKINGIRAKLNELMDQDINLRRVMVLKFPRVFETDPNRQQIIDKLRQVLNDQVGDPRANDDWMVKELVYVFPEKELCAADGKPMTFTSFIPRFVQTARTNIDKIEAHLIQAREKDKQSWF